MLEHWWVMTVWVHDTLKDAFSNRLFELGVEGINEKDDGSLEAYFPEPSLSTLQKELPLFEKSLRDLFPESPPLRVEYHPVKWEDWSHRYREFYRAEPLTSLFFLKPAWQEVEVPQGQIPLILEAGQAFGTGLHPSTRLALRLLEQTILSHPNPQDLSVIDVGTGTGILAIAASKLGVKSIGACDIDPVAVEVAKENAERNGVTDIEFWEGTLKGSYDVIVANILLEVHQRLKGAYQESLSERGSLILSGLLTSQIPWMREWVEESSFIADRSAALQEWVALSYLRAWP